MPGVSQGAICLLVSNGPRYGHQVRAWSSAQSGPLNLPLCARTENPHPGSGANVTIPLIAAINLGSRLRWPAWRTALGLPWAAFFACRQALPQARWPTVNCRAVAQVNYTMRDSSVSAGIGTVLKEACGLGSPCHPVQEG